MNSDVKTKEYPLVESVFCWLCFLFAYLLCRFFPVVTYPFASFITLVVLFVTTAVVLLIKKVRITAFPIIVLILSIIASLAIVLTSNPFIQFFAFCFALMSYFYFVYICGGNCIEKPFSDYIILDYFRAVLIMPLQSFSEFFKNILAGKFKFLLRILVGILIAIIPTVIVVSQLSYDSAFIGIVRKIFSFDFYLIVVNFISVTFAVPVAAYLYGIFISASEKKSFDAITKEDGENIVKSLRVVPVATAVTAVIPILIVYVIFFISQWNYYLSAFTGRLPSGFSYAEYAREGFFQLCIVSFFNLVIIIAITFFMKRSGKVALRILKIISAVYSFFTLALISTAMSKMILYIDRMGLTPKRVYTTWFMAVLAAVFICVIIKQFIASFKMIFWSVCSAVVIFLTVSAFNPDGIIARYNTGRYLSGELEYSDIVSIIDLGDSAVPSLATIYDQTGKNEYFLESRKYTLKQCSIFEYTLPKLIAKNILEKYNFG